jgi:hypothetical protein
MAAYEAGASTIRLGGDLGYVNFMFGFWLGRKEKLRKFAMPVCLSA